MLGIFFIILKNDIKLLKNIELSFFLLLNTKLFYVIIILK